MKLNEVLRLTAFGTKIAVRKDENIQYDVCEGLIDIAPLVQCFYVEDNEFFIDLDKDI